MGAVRRGQIGRPGSLGLLILPASPPSQTVLQVDCTTPSSSGLQFLYLSSGKLDSIISEPFLPLKFCRSREEAEVGRGSFGWLRTPTSGSSAHEGVCSTAHHYPTPENPSATVPSAWTRSQTCTRPCLPSPRAPAPLPTVPVWPVEGIRAGGGIWWQSGSMTLCVHVFLMSSVTGCDYVCRYLFSKSKTLQELTLQTC